MNTDKINNVQEILAKKFGDSTSRVGGRGSIRRKHFTKKSVMYRERKKKEADIKRKKEAMARRGRGGASRSRGRGSRGGRGRGRGGGGGRGRGRGRGGRGGGFAGGASNIKEEIPMGIFENNNQNLLWIAK